MNNKQEIQKEQLITACARLEDALAQEKNSYLMDSAIQRFEFTFELLWKTLKTYLADQGIKVYSPKETIKEVFRIGLVDEDNDWFAMLESRNLTSHVYNEKMAENIYVKLPHYLEMIKNLAEKI